MKKYIFALITIFSLSGCQQALNEFNENLTKNLNSNFNINNSSLNIKKVSDEELKERLENYKTVRNNFYKRYLLKLDANEEDFNTKFNNRKELVEEQNKIHEFLITEIKYFDSYSLKYKDSTSLIFGKREFDINYYKNPYEYSTTPQGSIGDYELDSKYFRGYKDNYKDIYAYDINTIEKYEKYLKSSKSAQNENIRNKKWLEDRKIAQEKEWENIANERKKVRKVCDTWLKKAHQDVYLLGVGDKVSKIVNKSSAGTFTIKKVEKNTFLLYNYIFGEFYDQKSNYIPYSSKSKAPSRYCYE